MSEQRMTKKKLRVLGGTVRAAVDFEIDNDGDLCIEDEDGDFRFYIPKSQLPLIRDWLVEVVPNE
jgi:hypothetical protein